MASEDDDPTPVPAPRPLDPATEALRKAAEARGVPYEPPAPRPAPDDPRSAVEQALAKAAEARAHAGRSPQQIEREERAREELARLKGEPPAPDEPANPPDTDDATPSPPRRRL